LPSLRVIRSQDPHRHSPDQIAAIRCAIEVLFTGRVRHVGCGLCH
jgi:hypothetical protein